MQACIYVCVYMYVCMYIYICMYVYKCVYVVYVYVLDILEYAKCIDIDVITLQNKNKPFYLSPC